MNHEGISNCQVICNTPHFLYQRSSLLMKLNRLTAVPKGNQILSLNRSLYDLLKQDFTLRDHRDKKTNTGIVLVLNKEECSTSIPPIF